jgi:hypothetical protein
MGIFDFVQDAGAAIEADQEAEMATTLIGLVAEYGFDVQDLLIEFDDGVAVVTGSAADSETRDEVVLLVGNVAGVSAVDDRLDAPATDRLVLHTVVKGDSLWAISKAYLGSGARNATATAGFGASTKVVIDPFDPLVYLEGAFVELLTGGLVSDGAVGISLGGMLPYESSTQLYNGSNWAERKLNGHIYAYGSCQVGAYPVSVSGQVVINADEDKDGDWFFHPDEQADDFEIGANGAVSNGWEKGPISLSL